MNAASHRDFAVRGTGSLMTRIFGRERDGGRFHRLPRSRRSPRLRCAEWLESRRMLSGDPFPYVQSINLIGSPQPFATTRDYAVTFSEAVTGVDPSDFQLALLAQSGEDPGGGLGGGGPVASPPNASLPVAVSGSGASYTVKISGITGVGTLGLNLVDDNSIRDLAGNPLVTKDAVASFAPQVFYETGAGPTSAMLGDFNLDGKLDVVTANNNDSRPGGYDIPNAVSVLLGNGDGTFQDHLASTNAGWHTGEAVGDVNADGKPDLVTANFYDNSLSVLIGKGDGTFQSPLTLSIRSPASVVIADINADGQLDIAATNFDEGTVGVFLGNGDGTFLPKRVFTAGAGAHGLAIADVNADGVLDVVTANYFGGSVSVLLGNDDGTFQPQKTFATDPWTYRVSIGDMNLDGKADIATANSTYSVLQSNSVSILLGNGDGTFQPQQAFAASPVPVSVTQGDVNGDGTPDLVVANTDLSINTISINLGNGDGTFRTPQAYSTGLAPYTPVVGDLNGDGRLDIVVPNSYSDGPPNSYIDNVSVFLNTGNGSFIGQTTTVRVGNVYIVTNTGDSGPGSLRQAILNANANTGPDTIQFAIVGAARAITLSAALPTITGVLAIDGSTQAGVSVVGSRVSSAITGLAFATAASDSYVGGLTISGFKGIGIAVTNAKMTLQSNMLTGNKTGISLSASANSLIGGSDAAMGNMLSGNTVGIALSGACTGTVIDHNMFSGNGVGVSLSNATGVQVGVAGNTIAESTSYGVQATGSLAGSFVQANAITGTTFYGVYLRNATTLMVMGNTISDGKPQGAGLYAVGTLTNTVVQGNTIRNNRGSGVLLDNARGITIGLTADGAGVANTIVNNSGFGLRAWGTSTGSAVRRNIISGNNVNVQIAAAKGLTYVPVTAKRSGPISHAISAPNASIAGHTQAPACPLRKIFLRGPSTSISAKRLR